MNTDNNHSKSNYHHMHRNFIFSKEQLQNNYEKHYKIPHESMTIQTNFNSNIPKKVSLFNLKSLVPEKSRIAHESFTHDIDYYPTTEIGLDITECNLYPGTLGQFIHAFIIFLSFTVLWIKNKRNKKKDKTDKFRDMIKTISSAIIFHVLTSFSSFTMLHKILSNLHYEADLCDWHFGNYFTDTTLGVLIQYCLLKYVERRFHYKSGVYDTINDYTSVNHYSLFSEQLIHWIGISLITKIILVILSLFISLPLTYVFYWSLSWIQHDLRVFLIVCVFPFICFSFNNHFIDEIVKRKEKMQLMDEESNDMGTTEFKSI